MNRAIHLPTSMSKRLLQLTLTFFITLGIVFSAFQTNVAEAQAPSGGASKVTAGIGGCVAGTLIAGTINQLIGGLASKLGLVVTGGAVVASAVAVPVSDRGNLAVNVMQNQALQSQTHKEYVLDPTFKCIAQVILRQMTSDIVAWINGGFKGNPAFVSNPGQFLTSIADRTAEDFLRGTALEFLCSPFKIQVRLALALNYNSLSAPPQCTWSKVFGNVSQAADQSLKDFTGGNFAKGGLPGWFELTQNSSNNQVGSYLDASAKLDLQIGGKKSIELGKLNWGNGFLSYCTDSNPDGSCKKGGQIATPGKVIESQLESALSTDLDGLNLADEFDEVLMALMNQLLTKIFAPGGGGSGLRGSSVGDYDLSGTYCSGTISRIEPDSITVNWVVATTELNSAVTWTGTDGLSATGISISKKYTRSGKKDATVKVGSKSATCSVNVVIVEEGAGGGGECTPTETKNVALNQPAALSAQYQGDQQDYPPGAANDGQTTGGVAIAYSIATDPNAWWQVDTGTTSMISKIEITERGTHPLTNFWVMVSDRPFPERVPVADVLASPGVWKKQVPDALRSPTVIDVGQRGRYVRVQRSDTNYLELMEVTVTGTITRVCPVNPGPDPDPNPTGNLPPLPSPSPIPADACQINPGDNLQDKINGCQGGTVVFNAGTYNVGSKLSLHSNTKYLGRNIDQVIFNSTSGYSMETNGKTGVWIEGMTFKGVQGINIEGGDRITVYRNIFTGLSGSSGVRVANYLKNSQITDNRLVSSRNITGIASTRPTKFEFVRINKNACFDVWECIHVFGSDYNVAPQSHDVEINDNFARASHRHAFEIQDAWNRLEIARNDAADFVPNPGSGACPGGGFMGISQATGGSTNVKVHDNKLRGDGQASNSDSTCFSAHEIISVSTEVYNNTYSNWGWGLLRSYSPGQNNIHDNKFCNIRHAESVASGNGNTTQSGNCL